MDLFRVEVLSAMPNPQQLVWAAMHQDYSENFVVDERDQFPDEARAGELIIKHLLQGNRGHFGPIEHPQIVFNVGFFPHSTMQQLRTHRVGISFDVQCLAGSTEITFVNCEGETSQKHKRTIAELHDLWTNGERSIRERQIRGRHGEPPGTYRRSCRKRLQKMRLRVLNEETGFFETGHIQDVMCSGLQPVYRVTLENGKTLDCTTNHRLFTDQGWKTMAEAVGLVVDEQGEVLRIERDRFVMCNGIAVSAEIPTYQNQVWLTPRITPQPPSRKLKAHPVRVIAVEYLGVQMTYDLEVSGDWHNFVANGLVVHNSFRYSGMRILDVLNGTRSLEEIFYLRPVGYYADRQGKKYFYSPEQRQADLDWCLEACKRYKQRIEEGLSEEHARGLIPFDVRQHFVMSCNARSLMHILDLRAKADAQLEIQKLCDLLMVHFKDWMPALADWYETNRLGKARLSP